MESFGGWNLWKVIDGMDHSGELWWVPGLVEVRLWLPLFVRARHSFMAAINMTR